MNSDKVIINNKQFKAIMVCLTWPTAINFASGFLARLVGHDMWLSGAISVITTIPFIFIVVLLGKNFPGKTIVEYSQDLFGKILGKLLGFMLFLYFLATAALTVSAYIQHLTDFLLPETPFIVVTIMHLIVICYLIWQGLEVIGRIGVIALFLDIIFFTLILLASLPEYDLNRLMPFFNAGVVNTSIASLSADSFTGVIQMVIAMILPMVANQTRAFRSAAAGLAIGGAFFVFYFVAELMVMGPHLISIMRIPSMDLVRSIQITQYLHRFESFMVALWYWSILIRAGALAYCALIAFKQTIGIKKNNPYLVLILGLLIGVVNYYIGYNRIFFLNFREYQWQYIALPFQYILHVVLLLVMMIKKPFTNKPKKGRAET
ncbi:MAG TPA: endospore germination permease [Syntrophomonadaceae bacterium]|nr:endospore germination permease [Syntrophomonadaceae bacterium]